MDDGLCRNVFMNAHNNLFNGIYVLVLMHIALLGIGIMDCVAMCSAMQ